MATTPVSDKLYDAQLRLVDAIAWAAIKEAKKHGVGLSEKDAKKLADWLWDNSIISMKLEVL